MRACAHLFNLKLECVPLARMNVRTWGIYSPTCGTPMAHHFLSIRHRMMQSSGSNSSEYCPQVNVVDMKNVKQEIVNIYDDLTHYSKAVTCEKKKPPSISASASNVGFGSALSSAATVLYADNMSKFFTDSKDVENKPFLMESDGRSQKAEQDAEQKKWNHISMNNGALRGALPAQVVHDNASHLPNPTRSISRASSLANQTSASFSSLYAHDFPIHKPELLAEKTLPSLAQPSHNPVAIPFIVYPGMLPMGQAHQPMVMYTNSTSNHQILFPQPHFFSMNNQRSDGAQPPMTEHLVEGMKQKDRRTFKRKSGESRKKQQDAGSNPPDNHAPLLSSSSSGFGAIAEELRHRPRAQRKPTPTSWTGRVAQMQRFVDIIKEVTATEKFEAQSSHTSEGSAPAENIVPAPVQALVPGYVPPAGFREPKPSTVQRKRKTAAEHPRSPGPHAHAPGLRGKHKKTHASATPENVVLQVTLPPAPTTRPISQKRANMPFKRATFVLRLPDFEKDDVDATKHIWAIDNHQLLIKYVWHLTDETGGYYRKTNRYSGWLCEQPWCYVALSQLVSYTVTEMGDIFANEIHVNFPPSEVIDCYVDEMHKRIVEEQERVETEDAELLHDQLQEVPEVAEFVEM